MKASRGIVWAWVQLLVMCTGLSAGCGVDVTNGQEPPPAAPHEAPPVDTQVHLLLTDFPIGDANVLKVLVTFTHVEVYSAEQQAWLTVVNYGEAGRTFDLLTLQNGVTAELGAFTLAPGTYDQIRLHLKGDNQIEVDEGRGPVLQPLKVPSGEQTGIKLVHGFTVTGLGPTEITVDFDAEKSVKRTGHGWQLKPTIKVLGAAPARAALSLQVIDGAGQPIPGAAVSTLGAMFATDGSGRLLLRDLPAGPLHARVDAQGFASASIALEIADGIKTEQQVTLYALGAPIRFRAQEGVTVESGGVRVSIPPGSVVDSLGRPITDTVELTIVAHDPNVGPTFLPGPLTGVSGTHGTVALDSLFLADVSLWQQGTRAQLAPGKAARVEFVLPEAVAGRYQPGDTLAAWWLDLDEAVWFEEGDGTIEASTSLPDRLSWVVEVEHFTWWTAASACTSSTCSGGKNAFCGDGRPPCADGYYCSTGTCQPPGGDGAFCGGSRPPCADGYYCSSGTCRSGGGSGDFCGGSRPPCANGYYCSTGTCQPPGGNGAFCGGSRPPCADGYYCSTGTCQPPGGDGAFCGDSRPPCADGYYCSSGTCQPPGGDGAFCGDSRPPCASGYYCSSGTCQPPGGNGAFCGGSRPPCASGYYCASGTCQPPGLPGAFCGDGRPPCASGYFCFFGTCQQPGGTAPATCALSLSSNTVPSGGSVIFTYTSSGYFPAGSTSYLYGTRDGAVDENGSPYAFLSGVFSIPNNPGNEGFYERYFIIRGPDNTAICRTNTVSVRFLPPSEPILCALSLSSDTVPSGGTVIFSYTSSGPIPAGSTSYLYGTRDGVVDENGSPYAFTSGDFPITNAPGTEGAYERYFVIRGPDNTELCTTNTVSTVFLPP